MTYSYIKNGCTVTEEQSFIWYIEKPGYLEGKLTNNKILVVDYPGLEIEKVERYEIKL